jgi:hypothetical protein
MQSSDFFGVRTARGAMALVVKAPETLASPKKPPTKRRKATAQDDIGPYQPRRPRQRKASSPEPQRTATSFAPPVESLPEPFNDFEDDFNSRMFEDVPFEALASQPPPKKNQQAPAQLPGKHMSPRASLAPKQMPDPGMISVFDAEESYA